MKKIAESHSQHSFSFEAIIDRPFQFRVIHAAHLEHQERQFIQIHLQLDLHTLSEVFEAEWFNYHPSIVLHDAQFTDDSPITVSLVLSPAVTCQLLQQNYELEHFLAALYKVSPDYTAAVAQQENWFIVEVKQEQTLITQVPDLEGAKLFVGFKTSWYSALVKELILERSLSTPEASSHSSLMSEVTELLKNQRLEYEINESDLYLEFKQDNLSWNEIIRVNENERVITCYAKFPEAVPLNQLEKIALVLMNENYSLTHGAFELDYDDGDLRFRSTVLAHNHLDVSHLAQVLSEHIEIMGQYIPAVRQYLNTNE